jgi:hypothetical protein
VCGVKHRLRKVSKMLGERGLLIHSCPLPSSSSRRIQVGRGRLRIFKQHAGGKDTKSTKPADDGPGRADFSAYWSLRLKQMMDNRRKFLEDIDRKGIPESELARKFEDRAMQQKAQLEKMDEEERQVKMLKLKARRQLQEEAAKASTSGDLSAGARDLAIMSADEAAAIGDQDLQLALDDL